MGLIIETDIGNDPDDFFTLCYLIAAGVKIDAVLIVPGGPAQVAITRLILEEAGLDIPIGVSHPDKLYTHTKDMHMKLVHEHRSCTWLGDVKHDGYGHDVLESVAKDDSEYLVIGPVTNLGRYITENIFFQSPKGTMQGGFLPYYLHDYKVEELDKFKNKVWVPTFNLNGDRKAAHQFLNASFGRRNMVGKNVCHTVVFDKSHNDRMEQNSHPTALLFEEGMNLYLSKHNDKKFHDPVAAVCHLRPEIGKWVRGIAMKEDAGWTTLLDKDGDYILADIHREAFWEHIYTWGKN